MPATEEQLKDWKGLDAVDSDGESVGEVAGFYEDRQSQSPDWLTVKTGLFGRKVSFVPAEGAEQRDDELHLAVTKDAIKAAPKIDDDGELSEDEERELFEHYGLSWGDFDYDKTYADDGSERPATEGTDERPVTHDEESELRDPEKGTRQDADEMLRPEHVHGVRPKPGDEADFDPSQEGGQSFSPTDDDEEEPEAAEGEGDSSRARLQKAE